MSPLQTGLIGIGSQGGPMAERMAAAGFPLLLWARRAEALEPFVTKGAGVADSVAALGAVCDHVGVCVVDDKGVADVCDQLVPAMRPGSLLAIHSTILPESCAALAARCATRGIAFVDAPVSGGGPGAAAGTLTVMCGGTAEAFAQAKPVFESFGKLIVHLGEAGSGQRAKIVNNALMAANMGLAHAALGAGEALGMDRAALASLIKESSGRSFGFEVYARLPSPAAFAHGAPLLVKDVNLLKAILPGDPGAES
ncbi:MAG: NAD(P)-dependent oxidoreductase, partial [Sphingomonadales bacterium]|nr:NAD(P)-dependent oxidoreductase [Sphingomonadales bacterium]